MWPTNGGDLAGTGYSTLNQINPGNVGKLKVAWQLGSLNEPGSNLYKPENQPLVLTAGQKGITNLPMSTSMFMQTNYGLIALNPTTGSTLWQYSGAPSKGKNASGNTPTNGIGARAISYGDGMIFGGQQDGSLVAVNAKTGSAVWTIDTEAAGSNASGNVFGESNPWSVFDPATPTAWTTGSGLKQDLVLSAPNGGESPMRGHFDAYDAKTGVLAWRFWATPDPTQLPFILTWGNPAEAATGGGACWALPVVDNELGLAYFGCGNHYPEDGSSPGKKLWTDTFFSTRLDTGAMKWYFQTVHHDEWDYDVSNPPMRINPVIHGKHYRVLAIGGKSGWEFVRNAVNGQPVPGFPAPEVKVPDLNNGLGAALNLTWPTQPEPTGGAGQILPHCMTATEAAALYPTFPTAPNGTKIIPTCTFATPYNDGYYTWYPAFSGGINWWRSAYNPATNNLYICANISTEGFENASATSPNQITIGTFNGGYGGTISALNMTTNTLAWQNKIPTEFTTPGGPTVQNGSCSSGDLATASGLVFVSQNAQTFGDGSPAAIPAVLYAYDAKTGKQLWSWTNNLGSLIKSQAMTYMVGGKQYLTVMATSPTVGNAATAPGTDHLTTFTLG